MVTKRAIGNSGLSVAPLALGGNVFDWTADEATSFAVLDKFVDAGGTMIDTADVYSAWVPGHKGGESEAADRPLAEARSGQARQGGHRDQGRLHGEGLKPDTIAPACDASLERLGIETIDLYYQHKDDESVPLADSLGAFDALAKAGKIRAIGLSQFHRADGWPKRWRAAADGGMTPPSALQPWYNLVERDKFEGELRDAAIGGRAGGVSLLQPRQRLPHRQIPVDRTISAKARAACANRISGGPRAERAGRAGRGRGRNRRGAGDRRARLDHGSARDHRPDRQRDQPRASASELIAALTLELTPAQIERLNAASS